MYEVQKGSGIAKARQGQMQRKRAIKQIDTVRKAKGKKSFRGERQRGRLIKQIDRMKGKGEGQTKSISEVKGKVEGN